MKRKLDKNGEPSEVAESEKEPNRAEKNQVATQQPNAEPSFADLGLDPRLVQAVAKQSFEKPTLVQRRAIPLALQGQDVLCKAKTGSGKTAAYVLPMLSGILKRKNVCARTATTCLLPHFEVEVR
jgi:ATP-dependent RNA helicase DDX56/DBP9